MFGGIVMKVFVIGGGASGLVSAIVSARGGADVVVLERNSSCGKKILVTGNGKCNYYNDNQCLEHYHSSNEEVIDKIINDNNCKLVLNFFDSLGVIPKIKNGYYYPFSNQAVSILNSLLNEVKCLGIKVINDVFVSDVTRNNSGFVIKTDKGEYMADKVVMAGGSYAYYKNVIINSYDMLGRLGHKIIRPLPALVQLKIDNNITKKWAGVRVDASFKLYEDGNNIACEEGEVMLTSYGISGICAMQLSGRIARGIDNKKCEELVINFVPGISSDVNSFVTYLDNLAGKLKDRSVSNILDSLLNYKLGNAILSSIKINENVKFRDLSYHDKVKLASKLVEFRIKIIGTNTFNEAQVCSGGVSLLDINPNTMESLKIKDLYVVGEVLDIDGDCGGYNLTIAWITGILAGMDIGGASC